MYEIMPVRGARLRFVTGIFFFFFFFLTMSQLHRYGALRVSNLSHSVASHLPKIRLIQHGPEFQVNRFAINHTLSNNCPVWPKVSGTQKTMQGLWVYLLGSSQGQVLFLECMGLKTWSLLSCWLHIFIFEKMKMWHFLIKNQEDSDIKGTNSKAFSFLPLSLFHSAIVFRICCVTSF